MAEKFKKIKEAFSKFKDSTIFIVVATLLPIASIIVAVLLYFNADALRDQTAEYNVNLSSYKNRVNEKDAQIILLNEQIKQKTTQVEILKSQVELLQKVNQYHEDLSLIDIKAIELKLVEKEILEKQLTSQLNAYKQLNEKFGEVSEIVTTISDLEIALDKVKSDNTILIEKISIYEPEQPLLAKELIKVGSSISFLNGNITVGVVDAYRTFGYINISSFDQLLYEREEIRPGKNIAIQLEEVTYVIIIDSITNDSVTFSLLSRL